MAAAMTTTLCIFFKKTQASAWSSTAIIDSFFALKNSTRLFPTCPCFRSLRTKTSSHWHSSPLGDPRVVAEIVESIAQDEPCLEAHLAAKVPKLSRDLIAGVLCSLNDRGASSIRFFHWVTVSHPGFTMNQELHDLFVNNLGRVGDHKGMSLLLADLSSKRICLTEKSFQFLRARSSSDMKDSIKNLMETLNGVGRSCRSSGILSLINLLCSWKAFHLALFVINQTKRRIPAYYNAVIAAKCRSRDFVGARQVLDEMLILNKSSINTESYNYLLGSLFKINRVSEGCELLDQMEELGFLPNSLTFEIIAVHACRAGRMDFALELLDRMFHLGIKPRILTHSAFIKRYFSSGRAEDAHRYVIDMCEKDKFSSNVNYSNLARQFRLAGKAVEAGSVLIEMMGKGLKPNFTVYVKVIKDLIRMRRGDLGSQIKDSYAQFCRISDSG